MYRLQMKLSNQKGNQLSLDRLRKSFQQSAPKEIIGALCAVAEGRLKEITPRGRTGRIRGGWTHEIQRRARGYEGSVYNVAEKDPHGALILAVLEKGSRPRSDLIYPRTASALKFFWERYDKWIYARYVRQVPHKALHIVENVRRFMRTVYKDIAMVILARKIKESVQ